jgi:hypothetical protein
MVRFDFLRYPVRFMIQDALVLLAPVILLLIGAVLLE